MIDTKFAHPRQKIYIETDPNKLWVLDVGPYQALVAAWRVHLMGDARYVFAPALRVVSEYDYDVQSLAEFGGDFLWNVVVDYPLGVVIGEGLGISSFRCRYVKCRTVMRGGVQWLESPSASMKLLPAKQVPHQALSLSAKHLAQWVNLARDPGVIDPLPSDFARCEVKLLERTENLRRLADATAVS